MGRDHHGLTLINTLLADKESRKFIERFNTLKKDLLDLAEQFHDLENFYDHQKPTWEKLRKAHAAFQLNRLELEKDAQAGPALKRMQEILSAKPLRTHQGGRRPHQHGQCGELVAAHRAAKQAVAKIDAHIATLEQGRGRSPRRSRPAGGVPQAARSSAGTGAEGRKPRPHHPGRERGRQGVRRRRGAHRGFPAQAGRAQKPKDDGSGKVDAAAPVVKKQRIVKPADIVKTTYLETPDDVNGFLDALRQELEKAIANNERIQIR